MRIRFPTFLAVALCAGRLSALDQFVPMGGQPTEGFFLSYDDGKINFMTRDQKTMHERPIGVKKVVLDKPLKAHLEMKTKRGEKQEILVTGFEGGMFQIERGGRPEKVPLQSVAQLRVDALASERTTDKLETDGFVISNGEEVDIEAALEKGKVSIVQFHQPGSISSERQGNSVSTMARDSKGRLSFKRVVCAKPAAPAMKQHGVTSLPQFWFYDGKGQLVTKLADRFTDQDIAEAVKKAQR